jgi:cell division transport system permease protein
MLRFYISESFKSIMRARLASFISIITLSISITFISASLFLVFLSNKIETSWKNEIKINVFINDSVSANQLDKIEKKIEKIDELETLKYFSKKDAFNKFVEITGNDFKNILETNPLPRSYSLSFNNKINKSKIQKLIPLLKNIQGVEDVVYDYNFTFTILEYISSMRVIVFILTILFSVISLYLLFSTSKLIIAQRMQQFNTMKLVGAKLSTIKIPLLLTGVIFGIVSSLICIFVFNGIYYVSKTFYPQSRFDNFIYFINFAFVFLGLILGPIGIGFYTKKLSLKIDEFK